MLKITAKEVLSVGFRSDIHPYAEPWSLKPEKEIASDMPAIPVNNIATILLSNIDDPTMSDADFREFARKILSQI